MQQQKRSALMQNYSQNIHDPQTLNATTGYCVSHLYRLIPQLQENQQLVRKTGTGKTQKMSEELVQLCIQWLEQDKYLSCPKMKIRLQNEKQFTISSSQLSRRLKQAGLKFRSMSNEPALTPFHKTQRVNWCEQYLDHDWSRTIFSDESYFQLERNTLKVWCTTKLKKEKHVKSPAVMVLAAISSQGVLPAIIDTKSVNSISYCGFLDELYFPHSSAIFSDGDWYWQHDNAPAHSSYYTQDYLEEAGVNCINWPSRSPDLNIIENCWSIVKDAVEVRAPADIDDLKKYIWEEWNKIDQQTIINLYNSIPNRLNLCIQGRGNAINY